MQLCLFKLLEKEVQWLDDAADQVCSPKDVVEMWEGSRKVTAHEG